MIFDFTISFQLILTFVGFAVTLIWNFFHVKAQVQKAQEKADSAMEHAIEAKVKADTLEKELLAKYASVDHVSRLEDRLSSQMDRVLSEIGSIRQFLMERK